MSSNNSDEADERRSGFVMSAGEERSSDEDIEKLKKQAYKGAIAQILTRNFSHSVGKHVLNWQKNVFRETVR